MPAVEDEPGRAYLKSADGDWEELRQTCRSPRDVEADRIADRFSRAQVDERSL